MKNHEAIIEATGCEPVGATHLCAAMGIDPAGEWDRTKGLLRVGRTISDAYSSNAQHWSAALPIRVVSALGDLDVIPADPDPRSDPLHPQYDPSFVTP